MLQTIEIPIIDPGTLTFKPATKTKGIFAVPPNLLVRDPIIQHLDLRTLEGPQKMDESKLLCTGLTKTDPWLQSVSNVISKYELKNIAKDGWLYFEPRPGNAIFCAKVTQEMVGTDVKQFQIYGKYGTEVYPDGVTLKFIQTGEVGDYICQSQTDFSDTWIVKGTLFESTYEIINDSTE